VKSDPQLHRTGLISCLKHIFTHYLLKRYERDKINDRLKNVKIDIDEFRSTALSETVAYALNIVANVLDAYKKTKKTFYFIIDQINLQLPLGFEFLNGLINLNKCIISASANNLQETDPKKFLKMGSITTITPKITFSPEEFKVFYPMLSHYKKLKNETEKNQNLDFDEEDITEIMSVTGEIPIELFHFIKQLTIKGSLIDWIHRYNNDFNKKRYTRSEIQKWFNQLLPEDKKAALDNISRIIFKASSGDNNDIYDRRIVFEYQDEHDKYYLRAINQIAFNGLLNCSGYELDDELKAFFIHSMRKKLPEKVKGSIVEYFIIESIAKKLSNSEFKFNVHVGERTRDNLIMKNYEVDYFTGLGAPRPKNMIDTNFLFVPENPNYPAYDLFYYENDPIPRLFCIQITTQQKPMTHVRTNETNFVKPTSQCKKSMKEWENFLEVKGTTVYYEIWIVDKKSYQTEPDKKNRKSKLNVVFFEEHVEFLRKN
jgi:hypothetical protein